MRMICPPHGGSCEAAGREGVRLTGISREQWAQSQHNEDESSNHFRSDKKQSQDNLHPRRDVKQSHQNQVPRIRDSGGWRL